MRTPPSAREDGPSKVLFSPDGRYAYVNHLRSATIDVVRVSTRKVVHRIRGLADVFSSDMALAPGAVSCGRRTKRSARSAWSGSGAAAPAGSRTC